MTSCDTDSGNDGEDDLDLLQDEDGKSDSGDDEGKSGGGGVRISFPGRRGKSGLVSRGQVGGEWTTDVVEPCKAGVLSDDGGAGLTGKVVISLSKSDMMTNGTNTPARGVVAGKESSGYPYKAGVRSGDVVTGLTGKVVNLIIRIG
ncbi:hypothetical protein Tco_1466966 [Tanacetum coccineum]